MENAKIQKFKCDILSDFQTMCSSGNESIIESNNVWKVVTESPFMLAVACAFLVCIFLVGITSCVILSICRWDDIWKTKRPQNNHLCPISLGLIGLSWYVTTAFSRLENLTNLFENSEVLNIIVSLHKHQEEVSFGAKIHQNHKRRKFRQSLFTSWPSSTHGAVGADWHKP